MKAHPPSVQAFSLVEVVTALALMAFALVPLIALVPLGMTANRDSRFSMDAMHVAAAVAADLRAAEKLASGSSSNFVSPRFGLDFGKARTEFTVSDNLRRGSEGGSPNSLENRVTVQFVNQPSQGAASGLYEAVIDVLWGLPPGAPAPAGYNNSVRIYAAIRK